ncbi:unnamed protein product [marine sediment metagenome]|uniref:Uncharacterized protein n=1 Tax=marine sediment metagenome TaxID=412755 RepID=X0RXT0_9ZZZZ
MKLASNQLASVNTPVNLIDQGVVNLLSVLAADGDYCGITTLFDVDDASTAFGSPLFVAADGNCDRCDASAIATMPCRFIALEAGNGSNQLVLLEGYIREDDWDWTPGGEIYVSESIGALTQTPPSTADAVVQSVGWAVTADIMAVRMGAFIELAS